MAWMNVLKRYKENECQNLQEEEAMEPHEVQQRISAGIGREHDDQKAFYTVAGDSHSVWTPRTPTNKQPAFTDIVMEVVRNRRNLRDRQISVQARILATNMVLKVQRENETEEEEGEEEGQAVQTHQPKKKMWKKTITRVMEDSTKTKQPRRNYQFHDIVSQYVEKMGNSSQHEQVAQSTTQNVKSEVRNAIKLWRQQTLGMRKKAVPSVQEQEAACEYTTA